MGQQLASGDVGEVKLRWGRIPFLLLFFTTKIGRHTNQMAVAARRGAWAAHVSLLFSAGAAASVLASLLTPLIAP
jgi:hypothetical protein